jgi:hydrogenase-1 operon protein HyaF
MKDFPIPVRMVGVGSQPEDEGEFQYMEMPKGMSTFTMPQVPEKADALALTVARDLLARFVALLEGWDPERDACGPCTDLSGIAGDVREVLNQVLGEGEVSIQVTGAKPHRIQESVFTGLWRCCEFDVAGALIADWLEAAPVPRIALAAARAAASPGPVEVELPPGAMNSPALLSEIAAQVAGRQPKARAHVVNLTLFPMTPDDHAVLERALPVGPVAMISRGFGNCRITSTTARDVWRVQYFNNMNTLILNTIEVVDVPEVALAAPEDLVDSRTRLAELVAWMSESCAEQVAGTQ